MEHELYSLQNIYIWIMPYPYLYAFRNTYDIVSESSKIMKLWWFFPLLTFLLHLPQWAYAVLKASNVYSRWAESPSDVILKHNGGNGILIRLCVCLFIAISKILTVIPSKLISQCYCLWRNIPIWLSHQCQQQHWEKPFISISLQRNNFYYPTALSVLIYSLTKWNTTDFLSCSVPTHPRSVLCIP